MSKLPYFVRLIITIDIATLVLTALIGGIGWLMGWRSTTQFSNGFFLGGTAFVVLGLFSVMGGFSQRADFKMTYARTASPASISERTKQMIADINQGYNAVIFLAALGAQLIVLAILIPVIFG